MGGKKVCFVDPSSTSGFLYPTAGLIEEGVIASGSEADISAAVTPIYAGGRDASALAVKSGDCDAMWLVYFGLHHRRPFSGRRSRLSVSPGRPDRVLFVPVCGAVRARSSGYPDSTIPRGEMEVAPVGFARETTKGRLCPRKY